MAIRAGAVWTAAARPSTSASAPPQTGALPSSPAEPPDVPRAAVEAPPKLAEPKSSAARSASTDFRIAVTALNRADHRDAARRFTGFLAQHPRDPRAQDAAYLRVLALQKAGDTAAMKSAALEYLRRYPAGFRRSEVEALSD